MKKMSQEQATLLAQTQQIAQGLAETLSPFCEVVVHDLLHPEHAILAIHNNLSGRKIGAPATELGLARILDPRFPQIVANYANQLNDGRQVKSTSIGIKDSNGQYVAALCLNVDLSLFRGLQNVLEQFGQIGTLLNIEESLNAQAGKASRRRPKAISVQAIPSGTDRIRTYIDEFAALKATTPRALSAADRRTLIRNLKAAGHLDVRRAMETIAQYLGISRATVYNDLKDDATDTA